MFDTSATTSNHGQDCNSAVCTPAAATIDYAALRAAVTASIKPRSAWSRGVLAYALELIGDLEAEGLAPTKENMLNGAANWLQYSGGGCSLIYNADICERLCSLSGQKRTKGGERDPNGQETWVMVQARALGQAASRVIAAAARKVSP